MKKSKASKPSLGQALGVISEWAVDDDPSLVAWALEMDGAHVYDLGLLDLLPICGKTVKEIKRRVDKQPETFKPSSDNVLFCCPDAILLHVTRCEDGMLARLAILGEENTYFMPFAAVVTADWERMRPETWAFTDDGRSKQEGLECVVLIYGLLCRCFLALQRRIKQQAVFGDWSFGGVFKFGSRAQP